MRVNTRKLVITAIMSAVSAVLMMLSFPVPFMPPYIKMDFSELPALVAALTVGPVSGVLVVLVKNLVNITQTTTGGVGEFANFMLGAAFVLPAGLIYRPPHFSTIGEDGFHITIDSRSRSLTRAVVAGALGAVIMAATSLPINYYITYPMYMSLFLPLEAVMAMFRDILPSVGSLWQALLIFNAPFTLIKGLLSVVVVALMYKTVIKRLSA